MAQNRGHSLGYHVCAVLPETSKSNAPMLPLRLRSNSARRYVLRVVAMGRGADFDS